MDKRKVILDTALSMFVEFGFHGTATARIAEAAGVANGTLFNYFKSKEELIFCLYQEVLKEKETSLLQAMQSHSLTKESFASVFEICVLWSLKNRTAYHYLKQFQYSPFFRQGQTDLANEQLHPLYVLIQNAIDLVLLKPMPADLVYTLFNAEFDALFEYIVANELGQKASLALIQECFELLWIAFKD